MEEENNMKYTLGLFEQCSKSAIRAFSSIFEQFRAVFTDFCSKMLGSNIVKLLEIARKLLVKTPLLEIARNIKKRSKF